MLFLVQASSKTWAGDNEDCMYELDGFPTVYWTVKRIYDNFANATVTIIAPEYDKDGKLNNLTDYFPKLQVLYAFDESPLKRMIEATKDLSENEYFFRINGLNLLFEINYFKEMIEEAKRGNYDCVKFLDDFPVHFTGEIYKVGVLNKLLEILDTFDSQEARKHHIHPKFLTMHLNNFKTTYYHPSYKIDKNTIDEYIKLMRQIIVCERHNLDGKNYIASGDQLTYHYILAKEFLEAKNINKGIILDIACGTGYGSKLFLNTNFNIIGADLDKQQIEQNIIDYSKFSNITFQVDDILNMSFQDDSIDILLTMETIEHIEPHQMLKECKRVLKTNGYIILSTPQNSMKKQCINPHHLYEYSLQELVSLVEQYFHIEKIIGLKAGRIYFDNDPIGANTVIFAKKLKAIDVE